MFSIILVMRHNDYLMSHWFPTLLTSQQCQLKVNLTSCNIQVHRPTGGNLEGLCCGKSRGERVGKLLQRNWHKKSKLTHEHMQQNSILESASLYTASELSVIHVTVSWEPARILLSVACCPNIKTNVNGLSGVLTYVYVLQCICFSDWTVLMGKLSVH